MRDGEWKRLFINALRDLDHVAAIKFHLEMIRTAETLPERQAAAGAYGGFRRVSRSWARCKLAGAMMDQLHITPTLHVAKFVMQKTFGQAAANDELDRRFAKRGRDATVKFMDEAREILAQRPDQVARYSGLYAWFCRAEKSECNRLRLKTNL
jgi:hypothetical protein